MVNNCDVVRDEIDQPLSYPVVTYSIVKILNFWADMSIQTEETKIRLLLSNASNQGLHSGHSICAFV